MFLVDTTHSQAEADTSRGAQLASRRSSTCAGNFLCGTSVLAGDTLLDEHEKGLPLQGDNFMLFRAPAEKLALFGALLARPGRLRAVPCLNLSQEQKDEQ